MTQIYRLYGQDHPGYVFIMSLIVTTVQRLYQHSRFIGQMLHR